MHISIFSGKISIGEVSALGDVTSILIARAPKNQVLLTRGDELPGHFQDFRLQIPYKQ
jgi:hypothetical protein